MKKFVLKTIFFLAPLLPIAFCLDIFISSNLRESHDYKGEIEVWKDIYEGTIDADIAIYGSSRAWVHINPIILEDSLKLPVYNFGIDGHNFYSQYIRHKEYFNYNKLPKTIILSLDVFSLRRRKNIITTGQLLPFMLWNSNLKNLASDYSKHEPFDYILPLYRYRGKLRALKSSLAAFGNNPQNLYRNKGFKGMDEQWNSDFDKAVKNHKKYNSKIDSSSVILLEKFLTEMKSQHIQVLLVYAPEYIEGQNFVTNRKQIINHFNTISQKFDLPFYNYSSDPLSYNKKYFYNALHLNSEGAKLFSQRLSRDLKKHFSSIKN